MVWGLGFRVWGLGLRVWGLGFRALGFSFEVKPFRGLTVLHCWAVRLSGLRQFVGVKV